MRLISKTTLWVVAGCALLSIEANAQTQSKSQFNNGEPSGYHIYHPPRFDSQQYQAPPQRPVQQQAPYSNSYGTRRR